jgi:ATP-binding cassette subfamily C protein
VYRLFLTLFKFDPRRLTQLLCVTLFASGLEGSGILLLVPLLYSVGVSSPEYHHSTQVQWVMDMLPRSLETLLLLFVAITVGVGLLQYYRQVLSSKVQGDFAQYLSNRLWRSIILSRWEFIAHRRQADLAHLLSTEIIRISVATNYALQVLTTFVMLSVYAVTAFYVSLPFTVFALLLACFVFGTLFHLNKRVLGSGKRIFMRVRDLHRTVSNQLLGIKLVKSFASEERTCTALVAAFGDLKNQQNELVRVKSLTTMVYQVTSAVLISAILYCSLRWLSIPLSSLFVLIALAGRALPRVINLQSSYQQLLSLLPAFDGVEQFILQAKPYLETKETKSSLSLRSALKLEEVTYWHDSEKHHGVEEICLTIEVGKITVLTGPSGSGKSTIADIVSGLLLPQAGRFFIDGKECSSEDIATWRPQVGYLMQEHFLLNGTILQNLRICKPDASEHEIWNALDLADASMFVRALPAGLSTRIGDSGRLLSGGERQRLSLARTLLRNPMLLVLDEATNHLDRNAQHLLCQTLCKLKSRMAILLITHQQELIGYADRVFSFVEGELVNYGQKKVAFNDGGSVQYG